MTGISTTGIPHLGNYLGAIKPAVAHSHNKSNESFYFLADYHALVKCRDPQLLEQSVCEVAATWLAFGLDTNHAIFYRQSDIPEITELSWILSCFTAKGLMNRAHAYKASVDANINEQEDADRAITMGLYSYPVLMSADILMFNASRVPVGADQVQHIEMTRDIAQRFNHQYGEHFVLPEAELSTTNKVLSGLDGRKMSKSYDNTIALFCSSAQLRKLIMKIKTDSSAPEEPKSTEDCALFELYSAFATPDQTQCMMSQYRAGISWGAVKEDLFVLLDGILSEPRAHYEALMRKPNHIEQVLTKGAVRAREYSSELLARVRQSVGIRPIA